MRLSISQHALSSHAQQLRNCFAPDGRVLACFEVVQGSPGQLLVIMKGSTQTREVESERAIRENAILLHTSVGQHSVWLSFNESWKISSKKSILFESAGFRIYLCPEIQNSTGGFEPGKAIQLMRIEWEGKNVRNGEAWVFPAHGAGHPHVQFDRCTVAFDKPSEPLFAGNHALSPSDFSLECKRQKEYQELNWFHKLHFPMQAPWHLEPYTQASHDDYQTPLPHAIQPSDTAQIEAWVKSVTRYTKEQFENYS